MIINGGEIQSATATHTPFKTLTTSLLDATNQARKTNDQYGHQRQIRI